MPMPSSDKPFKTINEQINILKSRNLNFITEKSAQESLINYGYYEIINGYKQKFMMNEQNDEDGFLSGSNFEHIYALYKLDNSIRNSIRESLEEFEQTFKQSLAYVISDKISDDQNRYTAPSHYNTGTCHTFRRRNGSMGKQTDRDKLLNKTFKKTLNSNFNPYKYYREEHHNIPPWILVKGLTFGNSIYWYSLSKKDIRETVIGRLIGWDESLVKAVDSKLHIKRAFGDVLDLLLDYRNLSSHVGRIYNHRSSIHKIRNYSEILYLNNDIAPISKNEFRKGTLRSSVGMVVRSLNLFANKDPYFHLLVMLSVDIEKHLEIYPEDKDFLIDTMELRGTYVEKTINK